MEENVINDLVLQFEIAGIIKTEKIHDTKLLIYMYLGNYKLIKEESRTGLSTKIDCTEEYLRQYLIQMKLDGCTDASIANYKNNLQNMLAYINKNIIEISYSDLKGYLAYGKLFRKWKDRTYNSKLICMRSFFGWLYEEDMLLDNPAKKLKETKVERRIGPTLKAEQREEVRCACKNEMELALCDLLYSSGIRVSELCRLNINDVDFSDMKAIVYGKGRKEREVYFNGQAKVHLERYLKNRTDNNLALFVTNHRPHNRISSSTVRNILKRIKNRDNDLAAVKLTPHIFRRTVGTDMINKGAPLELVAEKLGHVQLDTTKQCYAAIAKATVQEAHRKYVP